ncbi:helix-turn-helix transcriptional regulator [Deinococcus altitudinis]|uniref:helix-turn-helix transcriptional regulator n=1 Tax=Deinococcus altitudinis TaxID=468914 RepID=UPI003891F826
MTVDAGNRLGDYLRVRRTALDPAAFGFAPGRRRTPGLRREEVALRAEISPAWYTWLEQGRGGAPSADVLDRLARALMLTEIEREHLFLLGLGRLPEVRYRGGDTVTPRLQRLLDALPYSPAIVKTATWDVLAWNRAAALMLTDYGQRPVGERNVLRMLFYDPKFRAAQQHWESMASGVVAAFRIDAARAGAEADVKPLVEELCQRSPEFAELWREQRVQSFEGIVKRLHHPQLGLIALEYSAFPIDGRPDLTMVVYNPATTQDRQAVQSLLQPPDDQL